MLARQFIHTWVKSPGRVIFGPDNIEPILGVTALESVGVVVDPANQTLKRLPAISLKHNRQKKCEFTAFATSYGKLTERLIQRMLSQLNSFSVPSNSFE
jgi:hypothetical protein